MSSAVVLFVLLSQKILLKNKQKTRNEAEAACNTYGAVKYQIRIKEKHLISLLIHWIMCIMFELCSGFDCFIISKNTFLVFKE